MNKLLLFAGTTEGRELAAFLDRCGQSCLVCTATEYGESLIDEQTTCHTVLAGRLDEAQMKELMLREKVTHVVDATHPYAAVVSENIRQACTDTGASYIRLLRESGTGEAHEQKAVLVDSVDEAVEFLKTREGNIFAATGSKELHKYTAIPDYRHRVTARVLSTKESMDIAAGCGFAGSRLICMQGPFSEELNTAMLRQAKADWMVTKESGRTGGYEEKVRAAAKAGARLIVIGRPVREKGLSAYEVRHLLCRDFGLQTKKQISLIGIGMGSAGGVTREAWEAAASADVLIGARRMLDTFRELHKNEYASYKAEDIRTFMDNHPEYERIALVLSGDVGFYSGARKLTETFAGEDLQVYSGISSVVYLCGQLHTDWEDVKLVSLHGRKQNLIAAVKNNQKVFALVGKETALQEVCRDLIRYGLGSVTLHVGSRLSYPDEQIFTGSPADMLSMHPGDLTAVLIEHEQAFERGTHGLRDEQFLRDKVPMTKEEVRSVSLAKLELHTDSVIYDVGAGTGSVSVEAALRAPDGAVYAIERKPEAAELIRQNAKALGAANLEVIEGLAPEALEALPAPTHVFIGGSAGSLKEIAAAVLEKNPRVRLVINAIALETVNEAMQMLTELPVGDVDIACVGVSRSKAVGRYHMMMGQNPVYVIACSGMPGATAEKGAGA